MTKQVVKIVFQIFRLILPTGLKRTSRSYAICGVFSLCGLFVTTFYNRAASLNERSFVVLVILLSILATCKAIAALASWVRQRVKQSDPNQKTKIHGVVIALSLVTAFSLFPPMIVFRLRGLGWAKSFCVVGIECSCVIIGVLLCLLLVSETLEGFVFRRISEAKRAAHHADIINSSLIASHLYRQAVGK